MDKQTQPSHLTQTTQLPPAQLWICNDTAGVEAAIAYLQQRLCPNNGCITCPICRGIADRQSHAVTWIEPETRYSTQDLQPLFAQLRYKLDTDQQYFFVLTNADFLNLTCANSLLKSIEEPPPGYHFIFIAQRLDEVIPTIQSRCIVTYKGNNDETLHEPLFTCFATTSPINPTAFLQAFDTQKPDEKTTFQLIDALLHYWIVATHKALVDNNTQLLSAATKRVKACKKILSNPIMPGSSKIIWKELYLSVRDW